MLGVVELFESEDCSLVSVLCQSTDHRLFSLKGILSFPWRPWHTLMWISSCCCFLNMQSTNLAAVQCTFGLSHRMLRIGPDEITTKPAASRTVISYFHSSIPSLDPRLNLFFLVKGCTECSLFSAQVTLLLNLRYTQNSLCLPSNSPFQHSENKIWFIHSVLSADKSATFFWGRK